MSVATIILEQLGGRQFLLMTGSSQPIGSERALRLKLTPNQSGARYLYIELCANDTYRMTFAKIVKSDWIPIKEFEGVYSDDLAHIFTATTGLLTRM